MVEHELALGQARHDGHAQVLANVVGFVFTQFIGIDARQVVVVHALDHPATSAAQREEMENGRAQRLPHGVQRRLPILSGKYSVVQQSRYLATGTLSINKFHGNELLILYSYFQSDSSEFRYRSCHVDLGQCSHGCIAQSINARRPRPLRSHARNLFRTAAGLRALQPAPF
ncbi:hypothetical protein ACHFCA_14275 [Delftia tsuruhatensis]